MLQIKVLGPGCHNCQRLESEVRAALVDVPHELVKVTGYEDISAYDVIVTPALVINEKVVCVGRIPQRWQIREWALAAQQTVS